MTATVIVQARMGSTRLPGKVLAEVGGLPLLEFLLRRLDTAPVDRVVVATSEAPADDAIADLVRARGGAVVRGPEADVLGRFKLAIDQYAGDNIVRVTADCPLMDPELIGVALAEHRKSGADYTSNTLVRTFPDGLDVEVIATEALIIAAREAVDAVEREHVTPFIYRRPERFALAAFVNDAFLADERWTVDTAADLEFVRDLVARLGEVEFAWARVLEVAPVDRPTVGPWRLVPTRRSRPDRREWRLFEGSRAAGTVAVTVAGGVGRASFDIAGDAARVAAHRLLRDRLAADQQVVELVTE